MPTVRIATLEDSFVLHFAGDFNRINAYTLATTLINLADAAKAANATLNPGYEIEVVVEALGQGSFRATLRAVYKAAGNLFTGDALKQVVLGVVASFVYQYTLAPAGDVKVIVDTNEVRVEQGETTVVIPREIHEAVQKVEGNTRFRRGIGQALRAIEEDPAIEGVGFAPTGQREPPMIIPKTHLPRISTDDEAADAVRIREVVEITDVEILKAILERSKRRWQFVWNGMKISAPLTDDHFYEDFIAHRITIAPGDALRVRLRIRQRRAPIGVFINEGFEVTEVIRHIPRSPNSDPRLLPPH